MVWFDSSYVAVENVLVAYYNNALQLYLQQPQKYTRAAQQLCNTAIDRFKRYRQHFIEAGLVLVVVYVFVHIACSNINPRL